MYDSRIGLGDVVEDQILDLPLNVRWLVAHRDFGETREINKSQVEDPRTVNLEVDRKLGHTLEHQRGLDFQPTLF